MTVADLLPSVASGALLVASGYVLRWLHEYYQQAWRDRIVEALGGDVPGRHRRGLYWLDLTLLLVVLGPALYAGVGHLVARHEAAQAQQQRDDAAIQRHVDWLRSLPEAAKRQWPVTSYCRPSAAPSGRCECLPAWWVAEVTWPERLEGGDVACHTQR